MKPIQTANSNFVYLGPRGDIGNLPCQRAPGVVLSVWELTDAERIMIANGAQVRLGIYGVEPIPPVMLDIVNEKIIDNEGKT